jgi:hypothetical protein
MIKAAVEFASSRLGCRHVLMQPSPIRYEDEDPARGADPKLFAALRRKLFAYYGRLDFVRPSPRSKFLHKKT